MYHNFNTCYPTLREEHGFLELFSFWLLLKAISDTYFLSKLTPLFRVVCKCALFEKSNYDLFLLLYLFFIFLVLVLFFIAIGFYLLFKGSIFRSTAFL